LCSLCPESMPDGLALWVRPGTFGGNQSGNGDGCAATQEVTNQAMKLFDTSLISQ